ncbi:MAG: hypothetical protein IKU15_01660 [Clostridia bacterium]|nr:hypothetical protein [Clostridia bacterium]
MHKKMIVDRRFCEIAEKKWGSFAEIIPSYKNENLPEQVASHPDLSVCRVEDIYVCEKEAYQYYKKFIPEEKIVCGETTLLSNYPFDIAYNVLISEKNAMANFKYTDPVLKDVLVKKGFRLIDINQGYAACSSAAFAGGIITSDPSVISACKKNEIDVLEIEKGEVELKGYDYGFIGGASGYVSQKLLFFGDILWHSNYTKIKGFLSDKKIEYDYIENFPLTDVGTIIGIELK